MKMMVKNCAEGKIFNNCCNEHADLRAISSPKDKIVLCSGVRRCPGVVNQVDTVGVSLGLGTQAHSRERKGRSVDTSRMMVKNCAEEKIFNNCCNKHADLRAISSPKDKIVLCSGVRRCPGVVSQVNTVGVSLGLGTQAHSREQKGRSVDTSRVRETIRARNMPSES
ncbi:hypothetical protein NQ315_013930 [Exocentrus adspersus]|uniref:Uncharacterized protein n=1 Tax=Exocentrus adspersus TaxID=1586481 RepID=A0AAV8VQI9_9CUCU|nr:hypothetical protein NQ315_013930 [Exocentrus adspersus]